jgi:outer membrane scaffolding protein for murein synthesis (MipA/OmpV family)
VIISEPEPFTNTADFLLRTGRSAVAGRFAIPLLAGALLCAGTPAAAQEEAIPPAPPTPARDDYSLTIGLGGGVAPSYEGSDDYRLIPGGILRGKVAGHTFYTRGLQFYIDLIPEESGNSVDLAVGPVAALRLNRTSSIGDPRVRALGELDEAYELGGFVGIGKTGVITSAYDNLSLRVSYLKDVGNAHESYIVTPAIEYGTPLSRQTYIGISASADFVGDRYASYYFNVSPAGALASGLAPFQAEGGFKSWSLTLAGSQSLSGDLLKGLSMFAVGSYTRLQNDFRRSPIVADAGSPNQWFGAVGLAYTF